MPTTSMLSFFFVYLLELLQFFCFTRRSLTTPFFKLVVQHYKLKIDAVVFAEQADLLLRSIFLAMRLGGIKREVSRCFLS